MPLTMPLIRSMRFPARPSRIALMIGMPPATADSNATVTPFSCAAANTSLPCRAMSALSRSPRACLPRWPGARAREQARSPDDLDHDGDLGTSDDLERIFAERNAIGCADSGLARGHAPPPPPPRIARPARRAISSRLRASTLTVPPPTVPRPSRPICTGLMLGSGGMRRQ